MTKTFPKERETVVWKREKRKERETNKSMEVAVGRVNLGTAVTLGSDPGPN
jgi:hypothetical protein